MNTQTERFEVKKMAQVLGVSSSGYYRQQSAQPSMRKRANQQLILRIGEIYQLSRGTYGSPRIQAELIARGENCSRQRVARLMKQAGWVAKMSKSWKVTTKAKGRTYPAPNLLQQDFRAVSPNQRWVADITYVATKEGWLYVAAVLDLFSRKIVGLAMNKRMTTDLVMAALQQAIQHQGPSPGLVHHSDRGSQYTSSDFQTYLRRQGITASMSSTGNCFDNAVMESFFHTLKTELVYFEHYQTRAQAALSIFEYVEVFYNRQRRHSTLGYLAPCVFEHQWFQKRAVSLRELH